MGFSSAQQLRECPPTADVPGKREETDVNDPSNLSISVLIDIFTAYLPEWRTLQTPETGFRRLFSATGSCYFFCD